MVQNAQPFLKRKDLIANVYSLSTSKAGAVISFSAFADPLTAVGISFIVVVLITLFLGAAYAANE